MAPFIKRYDPLVDTEILIEPSLEKLPPNIREALNTLKEELDNEEITEKGYTKKRAKLLEPYMLKEPKREYLPAEVQFKFKELDNELHEGDITEKGYRKRKMALIYPYLIAINPSSYKRSTSKRFVAVKAEIKQSSHRLQHEQKVLENGQKLFKCKICGETFKLAQSYSGHCRLHRSERDKVYKCAYCSATYSSSSHLKYHMYKHTGDFPYTCTFCGKGFAGKSQLKYHELRHTGEAPHHCEECGSRFWKLKGLRDHKMKGCLNNETQIEESNLKLSEVVKSDESNSVEFIDDDISPSMTNEHSVNTYSISPSSTSSTNTENHYNITLPPPDDTAILNSTMKMKTATEASVVPSAFK